MGLKKRLSTLVMVTTTALTMPQVNASQNLKTETNSRNVSQQLVRQNNEIEKKSIDKTSEFLKKLKKGETIEYQGIKFDAQKLRSAQKNKQLSNFDFVIHDNETGLSFQDPKSSGNKFLILMPLNELGDLFKILITKSNEKNEEKIKEKVPTTSEQHNNQPQYLIETLQGRRAMTPDEIKFTYIQAVDTIFKMHELGIIDIGKMIDMYAEKIGGKNGVALKTLYHVTPLFVFKKKVIGYADDVIAKIQKGLESEKEKAIEKQEKEEVKLPSIVSIKGVNFKPTIKENTDEKMLSFEEQNSQISIVHSKVTNKIVYGKISLFDKQGNLAENREIQPEEWGDISKVLSQKLTVEQKKQLGNDFLRAVFGKSNTSLQLAFRTGNRE